VKPENLVLLGFIKMAIAYLENSDAEGTDSALSKFSPADLEKLKKELDKEYASSADSIGEKANKLVSAGEEAFDGMISQENGEESLSAELARVLDVNFDALSDDSLVFNSDTKNEISEAELADDFADIVEPVEESKAELLELGNSEITKEDEEDIAEFSATETSKDETELLDERKVTPDIKETPIKQETVSEDKKEEKTEKPVKGDEHYIGLYRIDDADYEAKIEQEKAAAKNTPVMRHFHPITKREMNYKNEKPSYLGLYRPENAEHENTNSHSEEEKYLGLYHQHRESEVKRSDSAEKPLGLYNPDKQIQKEEEKPEPAPEKIQPAEEPETVFEMSKEDDELFKQIAENVLKTSEDQYTEATQQEDVHDVLDSIFNEVIDNEEEKKNDQDGTAPIDRNDILKLIKEIQKSDEAYYSHIKNEPLVISHEEEKPADPPVKEEDVYVSDLISELHSKMIEEDQKKTEEEEEFKRVFDKIHDNYPYLSTSFIKSVYNMKKSISNDYPLDIEVIILHRLVFSNVENLRQFVEIALNHGYMINADENKLIVDVFKQYVNSDGKIVSTIYEVANQGALLNGEYEGYKVLKVKSLD